MMHFLRKIAKIALAVAISMVVGMVGMEYTMVVLGGGEPTHASTIPARRSERVEEEARIERLEEEEDDEENEYKKIRYTGTGIKPEKKLPPPPKVDTKKELDKRAAETFDERKVSTKYYSKKKDTTEKNADLQHCKALIERTLSALPHSLTESLTSMVLHFETSQRRGMANSHSVHLECGGLSDAEIVSVLVHELGHVSDLGAFTGSSQTASAFMDGKIVIPIDDASLGFYTISWHSTHEKKKGSHKHDFISGYAATNPFEDFAESFVAYVLHGEDFRTRAAANPALNEKYNFLKYTVFEGVEYASEKTAMQKKVVWDVTQMPADIEGFFAGKNKKVVVAGGGV